MLEALKGIRTIQQIAKEPMCSGDVLPESARSVSVAHQFEIPLYLSIRLEGDDGSGSSECLSFGPGKSESGHTSTIN